MAEKLVKVPSARQARSMVATALIGYLEESSWDELLSCTEEDVKRLTAAEQKRLEDADEYVGARLNKIVGAE